MWGRLMTQMLRGTCKQAETPDRFPNEAVRLANRGERARQGRWFQLQNWRMAGESKAREGPLPFGRRQIRAGDR